MRFAVPDLLWLLLAVPILALFGWWAHSARDRAVRRFAGNSEYVSRFTGQVSRNRRAIKVLLLQLALVGVVRVLANREVEVAVIAGRLVWLGAGAAVVEAQESGD